MLQFAPTPSLQRPTMRGKAASYPATLLLANLLLAGAPAVIRATEGGSANDEKPAPAVRTDLLGDPLPPGAVARLGSSRFRVNGWTRSLAFGPGDATLLAYCQDQVVIWERATGKQMRQ